jgi:RND superfamily putative drug exporter
VLLHAPDPGAVATAVHRVQPAVQRLPHVEATSTRSVRYAEDGRIALLHVDYDVPRFTLGGDDLAALQEAAAGGGVESHVTGSLYAEVHTPSSGLGEKVGIGVAVLVMLVAFGSVIAALMPVATAGVAIVTGLALVHLLARVYAVNDSAPALATMLGLGAGIDYALFIVTRHREELRSGRTPREAAAAATGSAGTSVLWAGVTVVAAICGLAFAGIPVMSSLGFASAVVVGVSVVAALTLLPALLALTGPHVDRLRIHRGDHVSGATARWGRWAAAIGRRPALYAVGCVLLLLVLAVPTSGMRLGMPDGGSAPAGSETRRGYELMSEGFGPGANGPLQLVVALPVAAEPSRVAAAYRVAVSADPDVASTGQLVVSPDRTTGLMTVTPRSGPQSEETSDLVPRLREEVLPPIAARTDTRTWLTGLPAGRHDISKRVLDRLPLFVGAVLLVSFLLLMLVFRSILVPLKAVLLNLLAIAAALGVLVAVFCWGWLRQLLQIAEPVPLVDVIPMMMFAIVFGLSMDYEVFLLSRVREEWLRSGDSRASVVRGVTSTAHVISAAATIMVCVFLAFTLSDDVVVKMVGLGLAVAVFLDATVIRLVLVPATMALLGDLNWWCPRWLDRLLPHVEVAGDDLP